MSHTDSTNNTWFEQYFEDRLLEMEPYLRNWASARYRSLDEATRDEAMQRTRITLWTKYQDDPETWAVKSPRTWTQFAKTVYGHSLYDKKERVIKRRFVTASDLETDLTRNDSQVLELLHNHIHHRHRESRDFTLAELRVDLARAIQRGLARLDPSDRDDMLALMDGIMQGYNLREVRQMQGWPSRQATKLNTLLRTVFYEEFTGHLRREKLSRADATTDTELKLLAKLAAQGVGSYRIAAQLGRSSTWAHDHLKRLKQEAHDHQREVLAERTNWPRERDGEDLVPIAV